MHDDTAGDLNCVDTDIGRQRRLQTADEARRKTHLQATKSQRTAAQLLSQATADRLFRLAVEYARQTAGSHRNTFSMTISAAARP